MDDLQTTLLKLALPIGVIALVLFATKRRKISWRDDLGFQAPSLRDTLLWLTIWIAWVAATEVVIVQFNLDQAKPWPDYAWYIIVIRIAAIGVLGPASEEIVMRGALLHIIGRAIGSVGAIFIVAALWAAAHYSYKPATLVMIFADGILLGFARRQGKSLWLPIAMHIMGNCFSITQSLMAGS